MQKTDRGLTIFYRDSQKLDKLIYLLTEERGLFIAVAKGAKKGKNRFGGSLEPLNEIEINLYEKENSEFPILEKVNLIENNTPIFDTVDNYNYLMAMIEIIIKLTPQKIKQDKMLRLLKALIKTLKENRQEVKKLFNYFLVWFLRIEGYLPEFNVCYECGKQYENFTKFYLSSDGSKMLCERCKTKNSIEIPLSLNIFLKVSKSMSPMNFISVKFNNEKEIMNFLLKIININGETKINSLKQLI
jgi:DNA repair protein RecO